MKIYFYKGLTRNPEIGNTPVRVLPNIWRLGRVTDTKFGTDAPNEMLLNAAKCQNCSFYCFRVIKGKPAGRVKLPSSPTQIRVKLFFFIQKYLNMCIMVEGQLLFSSLYCQIVPKT